MDPILLPVDQKLSAQANQITTLESQVASLQDQIANMPKPIVTIPHIQVLPVDKEKDGSTGLWYAARSAGAPRTGPHGKVTCSMTEPSVDLFQPTNIAPHSDNVYLLARLYPSFTADQKSLLESAASFTIGCSLTVDTPASVQQLELDMQARFSSGAIANFGFAWQPDGDTFLFDYVGKKWVGTAVKIPMPANTPTSILLKATCDGKVVAFTELVAGGVSNPLNFSHPVTMDKPGAPYFNVARQYDGKASAPSYTVAIGNLTATFS